VRQQDLVRALRPRLFRRVTLTLAVSALFMALLAQRLQEIEPVLVLRALGAVEPWHWVAAMLATWASFRAVAGYDVALHRHLGTGLAAAPAGRAGFAAIAIGQTVGLGVVSGALVRWRMLPDLGLAGALRLTLTVALSFLAAWGVLTLVVLALVSDPPVSRFALVGLLLVPFAVGAGLVWPRPWVPNLMTQGRLLSLAAVDCLGAGLALWLLLPVDLGFAAFLPVFLLALGAGLVSGAPAGLGAFEIVLVGLLPGSGAEALLAGLLAWRLIYYALPALAGAGVALLTRPEATPAAVWYPAPRIAEAGLAAQGEFSMHPAGCLAATTPHGLVALGEVAHLGRFRAAAGAEGRWPVLYKAGPRAATRARAAGMAVLPIAREAWLQPQSFRLDLPARAGLRRKLRRAEAAGVVATLDLQPDWAALSRVNAAWVAARGAEHGFSMGRFAPDYLAGQRLIVARHGDRILGFASFHAAKLAQGEVWTLDLLRPAPTAPDGTAQALILAALHAARAAGVTRLSLAAVPIGCTGSERGLVARIGRRLAPDAMAGLAQFKTGFAPDWQRLYIAGPSLGALALVGWEIWGRVRHPPPLAKLSRRPTQHAEYEIASGRNPWQREEDTLA
jgi:phosphatidylglycerol lysyltransferase